MKFHPSTGNSRPREVEFELYVSKEGLEEVAQLFDPFESNVDEEISLLESHALAARRAR